jgi:hypothetical protein
MYASVRGSCHPWIAGRPALAGRVDVLVTRDRDIDDFQDCLVQVSAGIDVMEADDFPYVIAERHPALVRHRYLSQVSTQRSRRFFGPAVISRRRPN